jgi:ribosomal protein S18 acetylase RimI-like enzyme
MVFTDPRYPLLYDANHAAILEEIPDLELSEIRDELLPSLERSGARHEQIEFWASQSSPAVAEMRAVLGDTHDVVMAYEGPPPGLMASDVEVREVAGSDPSFLDRYRESAEDLEEPERMDPAVLDQLYRRDVEVFVPRGLRLFLGMVHGEVAGRATLMGIGGVGYVDTVVTRLRFRRQGVARAMVSTAVQAGIERGDDLVHLLTVKDSAPQRLYERLGFRVVSEIVTFTRHLGAD